MTTISVLLNSDEIALTKGVVTPEVRAMLQAAIDAIDHGMTILFDGRAALHSPMGRRYGSVVETRR